jgi:DNA uptake protein ComE-like DNA-binding protein
MRTLIVAFLLVAAPAFAQEAKPETKTETKTETTTTTKKPKRSELMDINTATADQLKTLPGVTDDVAKKIIAGRPYTGKDQLLKQNMVDKDEYAKIRPLIVAKQPKAIGGQGSVEKHEGPGPATEAAGKPAKPADATKK